jgi:geranylgeranyl reductase family protein
VPGAGLDADVVVVGTGPAGSAAALAAVSTGASVLVLERGEVPRYKCCGGGLIGVSQSLVPWTGLVRDEITRITFTKAGRQRWTRRSRQPVFRLVMRADLDAALVDAAVEAGARLRCGAVVQGIAQDADVVTLRLGDGTSVRARCVVGGDGTAGRTGGYVGVTCRQVDLGLEGEFPTPPGRADFWRGRAHIDWGPVPGSYAWVFPKGDLLTVGVIGPRTAGEALRSYYAAFVRQVGLGDVEPVTFSGHLTRCRDEGSPVVRGAVVVAGDAAGLLEPWTREGISFALRSGRLAGQAAAAFVAGEAAALTRYADEVERTLGAEMAAGRAFLRAFERNRQVFHGFVCSVPGGWRLFTRLVAGETTLADQLRRPAVRAVLRFLRSDPQRAGSIS